MPIRTDVLLLDTGVKPDTLDELGPSIPPTPMLAALFPYL